MFKCPNCGCEEFYAEQKSVSIVKITCTDTGVKVLDDVCIDATIYEPEAPYTCVKCNYVFYDKESILIVE